MFDELKNSWKSKAAKNLPDVKTLWKAIHKDRNAVLKKYVLGIGGLIITIFLLVAIVFFIPFKYTMTKAAIFGMGLIIAIAVGYLIVLRSKIPNLDTKSNSKDYALEWVKYQQEIKKYSKIFMNIYMLVLIGGMAFYLYEVTEGSVLFRVFAYSITVAWFLIFWFYLRPRWTGQSQNRIQSVIDHYEKIHSQI